MFAGLSMQSALAFSRSGERSFDFWLEEAVQHLVLPGGILGGLGLGAGGCGLMRVAKREMRQGQEVVGQGAGLAVQANGFRSARRGLWHVHRWGRGRRWRCLG